MNSDAVKAELSIGSIVESTKEEFIVALACSRIRQRVESEGLGYAVFAIRDALLDTQILRPIDILLVRDLYPRDPSMSYSVDEYGMPIVNTFDVLEFLELEKLLKRELGSLLQKYGLEVTRCYAGKLTSITLQRAK